MLKVKICGITNEEDALAAVEWGTDALGFVFAPSVRQVTPAQVTRIIAQLPPFVCKVGVFVDSPLETVKEILSDCGLDLAQLHGSESPAYCERLFPRAIKAFRVKDETTLTLLAQYKAIGYLLDSYDIMRQGGTGQTFNWQIARKATNQGKIILSGGLTPENVRRAIALVQPWGVDVSSGVESSPGKKDLGKLYTFLKAVKEGQFETAR